MVMLVRSVRVTDKGQVSLPVDALRAMNVRKGTDMILIQEGDRIVLVKAEAVGKLVLDDLGGWETLAAPVFDGLWSSQDDEVWDEA